MDPLFATVISATLARDAQRAWPQDPPEAPEAPDGRGTGWLMRALFGAQDKATGSERRASAPAR